MMHVVQLVGNTMVPPSDSDIIIIIEISSDCSNSHCRFQHKHPTNVPQLTTIGVNFYKAARLEPPTFQTPRLSGF